MANTFTVILVGLHPESNEQQVHQNLASLFKTETSQIKQLLSRKNRILKKSLTAENAEKYKRAVEAAGAVCTIEMEETSTPTFSLELPPPSNTPPPLPAVTVVPPEIRAWWYSKAGEKFGPLSARELQKIIASEGLSPQEMVWKEGMPAWQTIASTVEFNSAIAPLPQAQSAATPAANTGIETHVTESLGALRLKITKRNAYLGMLIGFSVFVFSLFMPYTSIPGNMASTNGGTSSGWAEYAFLAIIPLTFALYPTFKHRAVSTKFVLINTAISFGIFAYNNILNRTTWQYLDGRGDIGANFSVGFWFGFLAIVCISICGISLSMHLALDYNKNNNSTSVPNKIADTEKQRAHTNANRSISTIINNYVDAHKNNASKNIFMQDKITQNIIEKHKSKHLKLGENENILLALNKSQIIGNVFSGIVITNLNIHFCTIKKSYFSGLAPWFMDNPKGKISIDCIDSIEIAEHDICFGTAYVGHELRINSAIIGYVRMGTGLTFDEDAISTLNGIFDCFAEAGIIKSKVGKYAFQ